MLPRCASRVFSRWEKRAENYGASHRRQLFDFLASIAAENAALTWFNEQPDRVTDSDETLSRNDLDVNSQRRFSASAILRLEVCSA